MSTLEKLKLMGYKVTLEMGWRDGEQTITGYTAQQPGEFPVHANTLKELCASLNLSYES